MANSIKEAVARSNANPPSETVPVDRWGVSVTVCVISAKERLELEELAKDASKPGQALEIMVRTIALAVRDDGQRVFSTDADLESLRNTDAMTLQAIFSVASRLNTLTAKSQADATESFADRQGEPSPTA